MDKNIGLYICTGCGIGDALDIAPISEIAADDYSVPICKDHPFLCGPEGLDLIKQDIDGEGVNTIIIAACSQRVNYDVFNFGPDKIVERVNFREQIAWTQPPKEEDTQMIAEDNIRMACAKIGRMALPEPFKAEEEYSKDVLVVGGGVAGMTAAIETAKAGYQAIIVEKEDKLGGFLGKMKKSVTLPYKDIYDTGAADMIKACEENPKIKVFTSATVEKISGAPGLFSVDIKANGNSSSERAGAIIRAPLSRPPAGNPMMPTNWGIWVTASSRM